MSEKEENKNKKKAAAISVLIHSVLLLVFLLMIAWREPNPPLPEYGIELNFGLDNVGTGEIQPETDANDNTSEEEAAPEELPEQQESETVDNETVEETQTSEPIIEESTVNTQTSPDVVKKTAVEEKVEPVKEQKKEVVKEVKKTEEKKEVVKPETGAKGTTGESNKPQSANQGDDANKVGDKGHEQGSLDARALYGNPGGGGGGSLQMTGWIWDFEPKPNDTSSENGRIVFEIKIDDQGDILSVKTLERSVSPAVEKIYRAEVEKLTFSKTSDNSIVAPVSTGKITFVIKSK